MHKALFLVIGLALGVGVGILLGSGTPPPERSEGEAADPGVRGAVGMERGAVDASRSKRGDAPPPTRRPDRPDVGVSFDHDPALGTLLYGLANSTDGTPMEGCWVRFTSVADPDRSVTAQVAGNGYSVTGLAPGEWKVYSKAEDFGVLQEEIEIRDVPTQRHDLIFEPAHLVTVKILTPEGKPLHEAVREAGLGWNTEVIAVASPQPIEGNLAMTDLRGYTRFGSGTWKDVQGWQRDARNPAPPDVSGVLEVGKPPPFFVAAVYRHVVLASASVGRGQKEVTLEVSLDDLRGAMSTIRVQVVDARTGLPVEGARVSISDRQSGGGGRPTDAQGRVVLENERVGLLELEIWTKDLERYYQKLRIVPGENDLGVIRLHPPRSVELKVVGLDGAPVVGAPISWVNLDRRTFPQSIDRSSSATTDAEGMATLSLGPGRTLVRISESAAAVAHLVVDPDRAGDEPVLVQLVDSHGIAFGPSMEPRAGMQCLTVYDEAGVVAWATHVRGYEVTPGLPAGRYTWDLHEGETRLRGGSFELPKDAGTEIPLR